MARGALLWRRAARGFFAAMLLAGCERFPEDPERTLENAVRRGVLRVGVVAGEPWAKGAPPGPPTGVEAELVEGFAAELGARVEWRWGGAEEVLEALEAFELDLAIGGFTSKSPWKKRVGFTAPYFESRAVVGRPPDSAPLEDLKGATVLARSASGLRRMLEGRGAAVVVADELSAEPLPVAAEHWEIAGLGFVETGIELRRSQRALAAPPGENAMLMRLEDYLRRQSQDEGALARRLWEASRR